MIELLDDLPPAVLGFEAVGEVEAEDYENVLVPAVEAALADHDKIRMLYVLGDRFEGYSAGAAWEDTKVGFAHIRNWERLAVVTDSDAIGHGVKAFGWMIPAEVKVLDTADRAAAEAWVSA
jgi:hypothetical protein